ncbi:MAG: protein kinase [Actinomycetota bacterium]
MDSGDSQTPPLTDNPPTCEPGMSLGNRYRLVALVSRGDFTEIWRAKDRVLGRAVAAKILLPEHVTNPAVKQLFRVEALAAARLTHPNIIAVFDTGEHRGAPFIVMEYLAAGNLRRLVDEGPLPWARAAQMGAEICAALGHAHSAGIIHQDLRPENVLFTEAGHPKVSDFGIASAAMAARPSAASARRARDAYTSPERSIDLKPDMRADVYSVGALLYECVVGKTPTEAAQAQSDGSASPTKIPPPSSLVADLPRALDGAIMKALAIDPAERFPTARALGRALEELSPSAQADAVTSAKARRAAPRLRARAPATEPGATAGPRIPPQAPPSEAEPAGAASPRARPVPEHRPESFLRSEGRWLLPTLLIVVVAAAIVLAIPSVRDRLEEFVPITGNGDRGTEPVAVADTSAYDPPPGDGAENDDTVALAFDADSGTAWSTSSYATEAFGNLKPGVGIYFDLGEPRELEGIRVSSTAGGWEGSIRHSDNGRSWSEPGESETARANHTFETEGSHRYWMVWITSLVRTPDQGTAQHPFAVAIEQIEPLGPS